MTWKVSFDPDKFEEALGWFRARTPMPSRTYYALDAHARDKAFTVAHVAQMDIIQQTLTAIDTAIETGQDLRGFSSQVGAALRKAWAGDVKNPAHRLETIFRTNTGSAFSRGRQLQMDTPVIAAIRPWRMFDDTRDQRESEICRKASGRDRGIRVLVRFDDPWLETHTPPLHHQCRSTIRALTEAQARKQPGWRHRPSDVAPAPGFGAKPTLANTLTTRFKPDYSGYDPALRGKAKEKEKEKRPRPPKAPPVEHTEEHWREHYQHFGAAARPLAAGRAVHERAKATDLRVLDARLDALFKAGVIPDNWIKDLNYIRKHAKDSGGPEVRTVADLEKVLESPGMAAKQGHFQAGNILRSAVLAQHLIEVSGSGTLKVPVRINDREPTPLKSPKSSIEAGQARFGRYKAASVQFDAAEIVVEKVRGYWDPLKRTVHTQGEQGVLQHEFGHVLETSSADSSLAARAFLAERTKGKPKIQLSKLKPGDGYDASEVAFDDDFVSPYVGKDYGYSADTEVTSVGCEVLLDDYMSASFLTFDEEHFWFTLGQLR